MSKLF